MEDISTVEVATTTLKHPKESSRLGWVEKHAELITKLEAEYQQPQDVSDESLNMRHYTFSVAGLHLLVPNDETCEILEDSTVHTISLAPKWLLGACNVRGDIVPIIDLYQILNNKKTELNAEQNITLILGSGEKSVGLLLNKLPKAIQFKKEEKATNFTKIPQLLKPFISVAYNKSNKLWFCIDFKALITSFSDS